MGIILRFFTDSAPYFSHLVLSSFLVDIGLAVVSLLVDLVAHGVAGGLNAGAKLGIAVLGHVLVGFLGRGGAGALDGFLDVVCCVPARAVSHELAGRDEERIDEAWEGVEINDWGGRGREECLGQRGRGVR